MKLLFKYLLYLLTGVLLFSCQKDSSQQNLLKQAQNSLAIEKYDVALNLLDSIQNPEGMGNESYMQYIVAYVGAKKEMKANIIADTIIFEAQRYFAKEGNIEQAALAHFYAGWVYYASNNLPKSLESFMNAGDAAGKLNNNTLVGKSLNNIGYIYFQQKLFDNAIVNYKKALIYYDKVENTNKRKLRTLTYIGSAYEASDRLDSAFIYFDKCLSLAKTSKNEEFQFSSLKNLGVAYYKMGKFDKALNYLHSALAMNVTEKTEVRQIHLSLLKATTRSGDLKSAKQYADSVIIDLPQVTNEFTTQAMYGTLADYYRQTKDFEKALGYKYLEASTTKQINSEINIPAILEVDKKFHLDQQSSDFFAFKSDAILFGIIGVIIFISIIGFFMYRTHKKDEEEFNREIAKYNRMRQILRDDDNEHYAALEAEIKAMLEEED